MINLYIIILYLILCVDYVGEGHCSIPCISNQGVYREQGDNPDLEDITSARHSVHPAFRCFTQVYGAFVAWFGYENQNSFNVFIAAGPENRIGGQVVEVKSNRGDEKVPTIFSPGYVQYAMSVR